MIILLKNIRSFFCLSCALLLPVCGVYAATPHNGVLPSAAALTHVQLPFIGNDGQLSDPQVLYYARTFGGSVYVTASGELVYALPRRRDDGGRPVIDGLAVIRETFARKLSAQPQGVNRSPTIVNSFTGNDPQRWRSRLPAFDSVDLGAIYDGINLSVRAYGNNIEKIFTVSPGVDPGLISMAMEGVLSLSVTPEGELEAATELGAVRWTRPIAFQTDAAGMREPVEVAYALRAGKVGFELGAYDRARPLVIDPLLASTFLGGSSHSMIPEVIQAMAFDAETNLYVAGFTTSSDFPVTPGAYQTNYAGYIDGFVARFDQNLTNLQAATYLGGSSYDYLYQIAVNSYNGVVYVAGYTFSTNFPASGVYPQNRGGIDGFVSALSSNLEALVASTYLGGTGSDFISGLKLGSGANPDVYVAGYTTSTNFPIANTFGTSIQTNLRGASDAFLTRLNDSLSVISASTYLGGTENDYANDIDLDTNSFVYVAGYTASTNFPMTNGLIQTNSGNGDAFVAKLSVELTNLVAATYLGGADYDMALAISFVPYTNIICVAGCTDSANFPVSPGAAQANYGGSRDAFLTRLSLGLSNLYSSTYLGGSGDDYANALFTAATSNQVRIYVAGYTDSANFPVTPHAYQTNFGGISDAFIAHFRASEDLRAATYLGGVGQDEANALALHPDRFSLFVAGSTFSTNFPVSLRAYRNTMSGNSDCFVTKLGSGLAYGTEKWRVMLKDATAVFGTPTLGWDGTVYVGAGTNLYAYDSLGELKWKYGVVGNLVDPGIGGPLGGLGPTPVVGVGGTVYVGTDAGNLYAISPEGSSVWVRTFSSGITYASPALGSNGNIYVGLFGSRVCAVDSNGVPLWTNSVGSSMVGSPVIGTNGMIYAVESLNPAKLYVFNTNGTTNRVFTMAGLNRSSPAIGTNGCIYVGSGNTLYCIDPNAADPLTATQQTWTAASTIYSSPAFGSDGMVYVGGGSNVYAFHPNGTATYTWRTVGEVKSSPALDNDGSIIVGSASNRLYSFNPNGTTNWVMTTVEAIDYHSPLISRDGTIYMADEFYLYAVFNKTHTLTNNWPNHRHDLLRTGNMGFNAARLLRPTGLVATSYSNRVSLVWDANANAVYYEVFRAETDDISAAQAMGGFLLMANYVDNTIVEGQVYYYWVRVTTPIATSEFCDYVTGGAPPRPPEGVTASKGNPTNSIVVFWQPSLHATNYYIYRTLDNETNGAVLRGSGAATNFTDAVAANQRGVKYYYWIQAEGALVGRSDFSVGDGVLNAGGTPPRPPSYVNAEQGISYQTVVVSWNASTQVVDYVVYRNTETSINDNVIGVTNGLEFGDAEAEPFKDFYYRVRSSNEFGLGEYSPYAVGSRLLAPPLAVHVSKGSFTNQIRVSWVVESQWPTSYRIYRNSWPDPDSAEFQAEVAYLDPSSTNYDDIAITRGRGYYYWLQSKNAYGSSVWSQCDSGGTGPYAPINVKATAGTEQSLVILTWNEALFAEGYDVYRSENYDSGSLTEPLGSVSMPPYYDMSALPGVRYYYWLKATNQFGRSELSGFGAGWRILLPSSGVFASDGTSSDGVIVNWVESYNASGYELWRGKTNNLLAAAKLDNFVPYTTYNDISAEPGVPYYYWVRAKNLQFVSEFSPYDIGYRALGAVDIGVSDFVFVPATLGVGRSPRTVSFRLTNYGPNNMIPPNVRVLCSIYISTNRVFNGSDAVWIGGAMREIPLASGASTVVVFPKSVCDTLIIPEIDLGSYFVFVNVQHALPSAWMDPNLSNNTALRRGGAVAVVEPRVNVQPCFNDYDGDGKTDLALYHEATGTWHIWFAGGSSATISNRGGPGFCAVPGDYDGDGKTDLAVYMEASGTWRVWFSGANYAQVTGVGLGGVGFMAVPGDYDGDGKTDPAVYSAAAGHWMVWLSGANYVCAAVTGWGAPGFVPVPADYDGDGKTDPAVYRESDGFWQVWTSGNDYERVDLSGWGGAGCHPIPADFDRDGRTDPAVYRKSDGFWQVWLSTMRYRPVSASGLGAGNFMAVPGDYDGDGKADPGVYWLNFAIWRLGLSGSGYALTDVHTSVAADVLPVWK